MVIGDDQFNAMICIVNQHIKSYYPDDMIIVENYFNNTAYTYFDLYRAHIIKCDGYTMIGGKRRIFKCTDSVIYLRSIRNRKVLLNQLKLLGLEVF